VSFRTKPSRTTVVGVRVSLISIEITPSFPLSLQVQRTVLRSGHERDRGGVKRRDYTLDVVGMFDPCTLDARFNLPVPKISNSDLCPNHRRTRAQVVLASSARGRAARREASRRRAERAAQQRKLDEEAAAERKESTKAAAAAAAAQALPKPGDEEKDAVNQTAESETILTTATPGVTHLERVVTIDGTEVHLTANVREVAGGGGAEDGDKPVEMLLVAVDKKARRSSRLSLDAAEISDIVGAHRGTGNVAEGPRGVLSAVLQKLTVFNSRRKDLFILSYKGKKVVAPH